MTSLEVLVLTLVDIGLSFHIPYFYSVVNVRNMKASTIISRRGQLNDEKCLGNSCEWSQNCEVIAHISLSAKLNLAIFNTEMINDVTILPRDIRVTHTFFVIWPQRVLYACQDDPLYR